MQTITIPLSQQVLAGLGYLGAVGEHEQVDLAKHMLTEYLNDIALGGLATANTPQDFIGSDEGEKWLQSMKNAKD